jgi:hypothetical protein
MRASSGVKWHAAKHFAGFAFRARCPSLAAGPARDSQFRTKSVTNFDENPALSDLDNDRINLIKEAIPLLRIAAS